jgi:hypothetical protein
VIVRIDPPLPVLVVRGAGHLKAMAHWLIDYGFEHDLMFIVFLDESRECWTVSNKHVRSQDNVTAGRLAVSSTETASIVRS